MSRYHHGHHSNEVIHIVNELAHLTEEQVKELYGIEITEDKAVYDPMYNKWFDDVPSWATFYVEQEQVDLEEDEVHGKQTHGDFY